MNTIESALQHIIKKEKEYSALFDNQNDSRLDGFKQNGKNRFLQMRKDCSTATEEALNTNLPIFQSLESKEINRQIDYFLEDLRYRANRVIGDAWDAINNYGYSLKEDKFIAKDFRNLEQRKKAIYEDKPTLVK